MATAPGVPPARVDRRAALPLWAQVMEDLERRLGAGEFVTSFPGEHDLCREYDVSRHTVREALRRLRERGVLDSGRGRSTRVRHDRIEQPLGALYSLFREVEARGMVQRSQVLALERVQDAAVAGRLGRPAATPLLHLARLRLADDEPLAVDRAWLPLELAEPLLDVDFTRAALYDQLEERCGVRLTGGRELLTAVVPGERESRLLQLPPGVGALLVERTATCDDEPVEWRSTVLRGDRFAVSSEWSRRAGYRLDVAHAAPVAGTA